LAQADSGIGVKNCVNLFQQKNWAGTFAVPWAVINDAGMLATLSDRDFRCGFAEAVKVAALKDARFFEQLERSASAIRNRDATPAAHAIRLSARLHLDHITRGGDPFEMDEARPLDFGHWSAHRLEVLSRFRLRHGEAVAIGVAIDTVYSALVHGLPERSMSRILDCLVRLGFHLPDSQLADPAAILEGLEEFRRHLGGRLTLTLLREIGQPVDVHEVDQEQMVRAVRLVAEKSWAGDPRSTPPGSWMIPQAGPANKAERKK
jgi:3-dehydroquinate synthase